MQRLLTSLLPLSLFVTTFSLNFSLDLCWPRSGFKRMGWNTLVKDHSEACSISAAVENRLMVPTTTMKTTETHSPIWS